MSQSGIDRVGAAAPGGLQDAGLGGEVHEDQVETAAAPSLGLE